MRIAHITVRSCVVDCSTELICAHLGFVFVIWEQPKDIAQGDLLHRSYKTLQHISWALAFLTSPIYPPYTTPSPGFITFTGAPVLPSFGSGQITFSCPSPAQDWSLACQRSEEWKEIRAAFFGALLGFFLGQSNIEAILWFKDLLAAPGQSWTCDIAGRLQNCRNYFFVELCGSHKLLSWD